MKLGGSVYGKGGVMISICMQCHTVMGEKEPLDNKSPTHGIRRIEK